MYVYSWIKSRIAIINLYDCATYLPLCSWQDKGETHVLYVLQHVHSEYVRIIKMDVRDMYYPANRARVCIRNVKSPPLFHLIRSFLCLSKIQQVDLLKKKEQGYQGTWHKQREQKENWEKERLDG